MRLTKKEADRIAWLTEQNHKRLGKQYREAAEAMAIAQVAYERAGGDSWTKKYRKAKRVSAPRSRAASGVK